MNKFRRAIFWLHLVLGVAGGIVIFIMCVTGALLSFEKNIAEKIEHDQRVVVIGGRRQGPYEILEKLVAARPGAHPSAILYQGDPAAAVAVGLGRDGQVFLAPYTGNITGESNKPSRAFFGVVTDLHRYIALSGDGRPVGRAITGACNLMFLGLVLTGLYIWMPRRITWRHLRPNVWFRATKSGRARDFNWHNTIGFWLSLVLIVLTVTGSVLSYQWAGNLLYRVTGNDIPPQGQGPANTPPPEQTFILPENINSLWSVAQAQNPDARSISLRLPVTKDAVFTIDEGRSLNIFGRSTLTLDAESGSIPKWEPYEQRNAGQQMRSWFRFTHTGESFGLIGQFVGFIACIGGAFLVFTGLSLAVRRLSHWKRRRAVA